MMGKWHEMLTEMAPSVTRAAIVIIRPPYYQVWVRELATMTQRPTSKSLPHGLAIGSILKRPSLQLRAIQATDLSLPQTYSIPLTVA